MNEKEAREIIAQYQNEQRKTAGQVVLSSLNLQTLSLAEGFLTGLESERKRAGKLVEAIKVQLESSGNCTCGGCVKGKNALAEYEHPTGDEK